MAQRRDHYALHCYGELCHFVYCLLGKFGQSEVFPVITSGTHTCALIQQVKKMASISDDLFLANHSFREELLQAKMSGSKDFRLDCRKFLDQLVEKVHKTVYYSSPVAQGLYSFFPELLFQGDDVVVFDLFTKLVNSLARCSTLSADEVATSKAEFLSFVVEVRRHHTDSGVAISDTKDIMVYLLRQFSFQSRHCSARVFKLCCQFIDFTDVSPAAIEFDFGECVVRPGVLTSRFVMSSLHFLLLQLCTIATFS